MNPLKEKYLNEVVPAMQKTLNLENGILPARRTPTYLCQCLPLSTRPFAKRNSKAFLQNKSHREFGIREAYSSN